MTITENKTNHLGGLVSLYHLLINADGRIDEKELKMGDLMKKHENIEESEFNHFLDQISGMEREEIVKQCVSNLKKCPEEWKIKSIAWMSLIANSDGFMAPEEWKLIYYIYNTELQLNLTEILAVQKQLPRA